MACGMTWSNNTGFIRRTKHIRYTFHRMIILKCLCNSDIKDRCTKVTVSHMNWRRSEHGRLRSESPPSHRGGPDSRRVKSMWDLWWTKLHWDRFFSEFFGFPCQYHSTAALHSPISPGGRTIDPLVVAVQRQSHSIDMNKNKTTVTWTRTRQRWHEHMRVLLFGSFYALLLLLSINRKVYLVLNYTWIDRVCLTGQSSWHTVRQCINTNTERLKKIVRSEYIRRSG
jgi:hypothetical protein